MNVNFYYKIKEKRIMLLKLDGDIIINTTYILSVYQKTDSLEADILHALEEGSDPSMVPTKTVSFIKMSDGSTITSNISVKGIYDAISLNKNKECVEI